MLLLGIATTSVLLSFISVSSEYNCTNSTKHFRFPLHLIDADISAAARFCPSLLHLMVALSNASYS